MNVLTLIAKILTGQTGNYAKPGTEPGDKIQELKDFIDDQYGHYVPSPPDEVETPKYERYEYKAPTDEQIEESARAELSGYANDSESNIRSEYEAKAKELEANKVSSRELLDRSGAQLKSAYDDAAEVLSNDSLKRGLARSSIALNNQAVANSAYTSSVNDLLNQYNQKVSAIDEELNSLDTKLQSALNSFRISHAAKITERINELKAEREKNVQKAIEYNNSLTKAEFDDEITKEKTQSDMYMEALKQKKMEIEVSNAITPEEKEKMYKAIYDKVVSILDSMPYKEARMMFLNEPIFRECLNDFYYLTLLNKYSKP